MQELGRQIFPKPIDSFTPLIQRYISVVEEMPIPQQTKYNLVIYAIFCLETSNVTELKKPKDIASILGLSEQDVRQAIKTIVNSDDDEWNSFEKILTELKQLTAPNTRHTPSRRQAHFNRIVALRNQNKNHKEIGEILGLSAETVKVYYAIGKKGF